MLQEELYQTSYYHALDLHKQGTPQQDILNYLTEAAETASSCEIIASILLLDAEGLLRNAASPKLPIDYIKAIDGIKPHPQLGTCASAAATGSIVITEDFNADDKWAELRHLPTAYGYKGAWSMPIMTENNVLGTFGTYYFKKKTPSKTEIEGVRLLAAAVSVVLTNKSPVLLL